ncbi:MAG: GNAT family N-acetyltransferase [Coleofasciculaceae cyanobacterium]
MSIQKECEVLQSGLSKAMNLLTEARTNTNRLSSCSVSEMEEEISDILDICHEGMSSLQASMEQIQLIQSMMGNGLQSSSDNSSRGDKLVEAKDQFADSLDYKVKRNCLEDKDGYASASLEVVGKNNEDMGYINIRKDDDGRIRIEDIMLPEKYQRKGIGTKLFKAAEKLVSDGTVLYLGSNDEPKFWKKMGFKPQKYADGRIEYLKTVSHQK